MDTVFFGNEESGHACKVALGLRHFGVAYEYRWIDIRAPRETRPREFLEASRFAEVPLLMVDGRSLTQSNAILIHLAERDGAGVSSDERELLFWEANRIGMVIPQLIAERRTKGEGFGADAVKWLRARYDIDIARLDDLLSADFILGERPSIADICVFGYVQWHHKAGLPVPGGVEAWLDRMKALPIHGSAASLLGRELDGRRFDPGGSGNRAGAQP